MRTRETFKTQSISHRITHWAKSNDWYHSDIQTNQLRLEQSFGQAIETIAKDLDYHNQPKLRRQVFDCYDMLMAKCRQIDMVCRTGCRSEAELLELEFLRSKAVGAAAELAEVLGLLQRKDGTTDFADNKCEKKNIKDNDDWITFAQAAEILAVSKPTLTRWADDGKIQSNGQKGRLRKLNKVSVLLQKQAMEDQAIRQDIKDLREDAKKFGS
jgi:excisionase family DNA binding protein